MACFTWNRRRNAMKYRPELEDFLVEGLDLKQASMAMEAVYSCAIEGITVDKNGIKNICRQILESENVRHT